MPKRRHDNDRIWRLENRLAEVESILRDRKIEVPDVLAGTGISVALNRARRVVTIGSTYDDSDVIRWRDQHVGVSADYLVNDVVYESGSPNCLYRCILAHTSAAGTNPTGASGATYWAEFGVKDLDDLGNVVAPSPSTGEFLRFNGTNWVDADIIVGDLPEETPPAGPTTMIYFNNDVSQSGEIIPWFTAQDDFTIVDIEASEDGVGGSYAAYLYVGGSSVKQFNVGSNAMSSAAVNSSVSEGEEVQLYFEGDEFPVWFSAALEITERT